MPLFDNSVIYKLVHKDDQDNEMIYIGSTTNFRGRKYGHKNSCCNENKKDYNIGLYQYIRENGEWDEWEMVTIETYPCESKRDLEIRERYWIEKFKSKLNKRIPTRNKKEYREDNKEQLSEKHKNYYEENKEQICEKSRKYHNENKEQLSEKHKKYYEENKEYFKENRKNYYEANKEQISERRKEYNKKIVTCECGCKVTKWNLSHHIKTDKHKNKMEELNN
jgi:hypothetical protein